MLVPAPTTRMRHRTSSRWCEKRAFGRTSRQFRSVLHNAGFTRIDFKGSHDRGELDTCHAKPIRRIEQHLGFYFTSFSRMASEVALEQAKTTPHNERELNAMLQLVDEAESTVRTRKPSVCEVDRMLYESCQIKRPLTQKITNRNIDEIYVLGPSSGALGGTAGGRAATDSCYSRYRRSGIGRPRLAEESAAGAFPLL